MKEAADPGQIRKVKGKVLTKKAPRPEQKKAGIAAAKVVAKVRAKRSAAMAVNINPQLGAGA
jgi:hypothetical protein